MVQFYKLKSYLLVHSELFPKRNGPGILLDNDGCFHIWFQTKTTHYRWCFGAKNSLLTTMLDIQEIFDKQFIPRIYNKHVSDEEGIWAHDGQKWIRWFNLEKLPRTSSAGEFTTVTLKKS